MFGFRRRRLITKKTVEAIDLMVSVVVDHDQRLDSLNRINDEVVSEISVLREQNERLHHTILEMQHGIIRNGYFDIMDAEKEKQSVSEDPVDGFVNDFVKAAEPLMKYLSENHHPHVTVIVTGNTAEMVEGMLFHKDDKYIVD